MSVKFAARVNNYNGKVPFVQKPINIDIVHCLDTKGLKTCLIASVDNDGYVRRVRCGRVDAPVESGEKCDGRYCFATFSSICSACNEPIKKNDILSNSKFKHANTKFRMSSSCSGPLMHPDDTAISQMVFVHKNCFNTSLMAQEKCGCCDQFILEHEERDLNVFFIGDRRIEGYRHKICPSLNGFPFKMQLTHEPKTINGVNISKREQVLPSAKRITFEETEIEPRRKHQRGSSGQCILNKDDLAVDHDSSDNDYDSDADSRDTSILVE